MSRSVGVQFIIRSMAVPSSSVCPGLSASSLWSGPWLYHPHLYVQVCRRPVYDQVHGCTILICMSRSVGVQFMIRSMAVPSSSVCPGLSASSLWSGPWLYHPHLYVQVCQRPVYDQVHGCTIRTHLYVQVCQCPVYDHIDDLLNLLKVHVSLSEVMECATYKLNNE